MSNQNLLSQSYNQIINQVMQGQNQNFQMLAQPIDFSWPVAPTGQMSPEAYQLVSIMPQWSDVAAYSASSSTFFSAYNNIFAHVTFKVSPEKQNDLNQLQNQWQVALNAINGATTEASTAYETAKQNGGAVFSAMYPDITAWLAGPGSAYQNKINNLTETAKALGNQYKELSEALLVGKDELVAAMKATKEPTGSPGSQPSPPGWTKVPNSAGDLEWQPSFNIGTTGQDWRAQLTSGTQGAFTVNLDAGKSDTSFDHSWAGGSASYGNFFWGINGGGGWEKWDLSESDAGVQASISVKSSTIVPITPGVWYDGGFMKDLARNTSGSGATIEQGWQVNGGQGSNSLFGQYGILSTVVTGLVVVYQPSFKITMNSSTFSQYKEKFDASGGLRIGPFTFGGHGGHESTYTHSTSNGTTYEGGSTSTDPLIIGMTVAFPGVEEVMPAKSN
ncbi:hypothetical protein [Pontibacter sp. G13]|uniref:hypothetical protein n=1 Tax=Pontibacter sp. G13 TaxID=3074898 RepID=UPI002889C8FB|nr:hypothetical protein [Pontibacter sp. G13]WNJ20564.1 hypothetical protein RJD25_08780 [Pontibacter sp. G13]